MSQVDQRPSLLVTGAKGKIGQVLSRAWPPSRLDPFDLPDGDALDRAALTDAARGHDTLVHLAWDASENYRSESLSPSNLPMALNALEAAVAAGIRRVILASSVHAHAFWPPRATLIEPTQPPIPDSPYGASKVFIEAIGRRFSAHRDLEVVAIRFGGVGQVDKRPKDPPERAVWLPHPDCVSLLEAAVAEPLGPSRYALAVGVGDSRDRVHAYSTDLRWRPDQ